MVRFLCQFYTVCNFGLGIVKSERMKYIQSNVNFLRDYVMKTMLPPSIKINILLKLRNAVVGPERSNLEDIL